MTQGHLITFGLIWIGGMDLPWGAFGAFLLEPVRLRFSSSCPGAAAFVDQKESAGFLLLPSNF
jgi:hypothetical protein